MDKEIRNAIERATQRARNLLVDDFADQLEGTFDVLPDGYVAPEAGAHLSPHQVFQREKIVAAIDHKQAIGMKAPAAIADYLRDAAFTTLNRFVALKMLEARALVQECITKGEQSSGYREFCGMAPGVALLPNSAGYRLYIESLFDELSTEVKVLFDRRDAASVLWPKRATFKALLEVFNSTDLSGVWGDDETIGWVYQFFNSVDERKKMREESQTPRNSRELAVRNQFFTPRYVVEFLVDNTLGRAWIETHGLGSKLTERCRYFVRSTEEPLTTRTGKDPRDLRILDPACGSGHFLLYCFDLLLTIYEEAWGFESSSAVSYDTGRNLRDDYPDILELRCALPALILAHNLHGVDIDPRAAQIAALALWLRAQRAWNDFGVPALERPSVRRTNVVVAEPMPGDTALVDEFAKQLEPPLLRDLFRKMISEMRLAGELGSLIPVELGLAAEVRAAREQFLASRESKGFLPGMEPAQKQGKFDFSGIDDDGFFHQAEARIIDTLRHFAETTAGGAGMRRRLFAGDSAQGIALIDLLRKQFDVVLMNPPFGEATNRATEFLSKWYAEWNKNILCAFIARAHKLTTSEGLCGTVVDRTINEKSTYQQFRRKYLLGNESALHLVADLGWNVLDANVEVSAFTYGNVNSNHKFHGIDARDEIDKSEVLRHAENFITMSVHGALKLPNSVIGYFFPQYVIAIFETLPSLREAGFDFFEGHTLKSERYFRLVWECPQHERESWKPLFNGTAYSRFAYPHHDAVMIGRKSGVFADKGTVLRNLAKHEKPAVCFGKRGEFVDAQMLPAGFISTVEGKACVAPNSDEAWCLLALMNSRLFQAIINLYTGQHKYSGYVEVIPYAGTNNLGPAAEIARNIADAKWRLWSRVEISPNFVGLQGISPEDLCTELTEELSIISDMEVKLNQAVIEAYGLTGNIEVSKHITQACATEPENKDPFRGNELTQNAALCVQYAIGCAFGRFPTDVTNFNSDSISSQSLLENDNEKYWPDILVDELGIKNDICYQVTNVLGELVTKIVSALAVRDLRTYLANHAFNFHFSYYSRSGRLSPVYWQLSIPSARYSVWLYIHAFSNDTFFRVQNDFLIQKVAHEERKLEGMINDLRDKATPDSRKELAAQELFVDELRTFFENVKLVAPIWNPNLCDGVIINFAPLWQLVPQNKSLQKTLKAMWEEICVGKYDWAHLAMHLWPERVVPKCATDRSLSIAHGLEEVFWVEGEKGKWIERATPTRSIEDLVRERSSPAVKAALKNLLNAPVVKALNASTRSRSRR